MTIFLHLINHHAMKASGGSGGIEKWSLNLRSTWKWLALMISPLCYLGSTPCKPWIETWMDHRITLDAVKKWYSRITSAKALSFCMTTISASITNLTALLPHSRDCSRYLSRRILAPPPLWLQKYSYLRWVSFSLKSERQNTFQNTRF